METAKQALGLLDDKSFALWHSDKKNYHKTLKGLIPEDVLEMDYVIALKKLEQAL